MQPKEGLWSVLRSLNPVVNLRVPIQSLLPPVLPAAEDCLYSSPSGCSPRDSSTVTHFRETEEVHKYAQLGDNACQSPIIEVFVLSTCLPMPKGNLRYCCRLTKRMEAELEEKMDSLGSISLTFILKRL
jgi:hypothetical protein